MIGEEPVVFFNGRPSIIRGSNFDHDIVNAYKVEIAELQQLVFKNELTDGMTDLYGKLLAMRNAHQHRHTLLTHHHLPNVSYDKAMKYSLGGYFISDHDSFTSYFKRIVFRAGLKYEETGLIVNSESIKDAGFSFGLGLPVTGSFSNINFGFEYGKRGTTSAGLIQENYAKFSVGLSLNDRWFVKRKFD